MCDASTAWLIAAFLVAVFSAARSDSCVAALFAIRRNNGRN